MVSNIYFKILIILLYYNLTVEIAVSPSLLYMLRTVLLYRKNVLSHAVRIWSCLVEGHIGHMAAGCRLLDSTTWCHTSYKRSYLYNNKAIIYYIRQHSMIIVI